MDCMTRRIPALSLLTFGALLLGCPAPSEEIGATLDDGAGSDTGGADEGADDGTDSIGATSQASGEGGSASVGDAGGSSGSDAGSDGDTGSEQACFDAWAEPMAIVEAPSRPDAGVPGMRLRFTYGTGVVTLTEITDEQIVRPPDGPFSPRENSGTWVELRDAADQEVYTRIEHQLVPESVEVTGPMSNLVSCPEDGFLQVTNLPNDPTATQVVFFQEAIDGETTLETIELLRFDLPPS